MGQKQKEQREQRVLGRKLILVKIQNSNYCGWRKKKSVQADRLISGLADMADYMLFFGKNEYTEIPCFMFCMYFCKMLSTNILCMLLLTYI